MLQGLSPSIFHFFPFSYINNNSFSPVAPGLCEPMDITGISLRVTEGNAGCCKLWGISFFHLWPRTVPLISKQLWAKLKSSEGCFCPTGVWMEGWRCLSTCVPVQLASEVDMEGWCCICVQTSASQMWVLVPKITTYRDWCELCCKDWRGKSPLLKCNFVYQRKDFSFSIRWGFHFQNAVLLWRLLHKEKVWVLQRKTHRHSYADITLCSLFSTPSSVLIQVQYHAYITQSSNGIFQIKMLGFLSSLSN